MKLSPLTKYRLRLVGLITIVWVLMGVVIEINNALSFDPDSGQYFVHFPFGNNALQHLLITAVGPLLGGVAGGSLILFILRERLKRRSFGYKLAAQSLVFLGLIFLLVMLVGSIQALTIGTDFLRTFVDVVFTWRVFRLVITWFVVVIATLLLLDIIDKYGKGVLWKLVTGKYHHPVTEERIFMFVDLRDSTAITERLGDEQYFRLLRAVFYLTTEPVLNAEGDIYQYVGDEMIISWEIEDGLRNANCIRCYQEISEVIRKHGDTFMKEFGIIPEFKAAIHMGNVVVGEIGVIKKDIVYAGDVLNSTSRILSLTKTYHANLLVSDRIAERLKAFEDLQMEFVDEIVLRGRTTGTQIFRAEMRS